MNQTCKVCGEPAAGFHFGAFTCEGCKSFFGRSFNNVTSISDCKNNGECVINKKNRTTCKACRLRKCLVVGMSKSGSRYGRRSNWFKIHCLLQEQQQNQGSNPVNFNPTFALSMLKHSTYKSSYSPRSDLHMDSSDDQKRSSVSPSLSSPSSSLISETSSVDLLNKFKTSTKKDTMSHQNKDMFLPFPFPRLSLMPPPPHHLFFPGYSHPYQYQDILRTVEGQQLQQQQQHQQHQQHLFNRDTLSKQYFMDALLQTKEDRKVEEDDDEDHLKSAVHQQKRISDKCDPKDDARATALDHLVIRAAAASEAKSLVSGGSVAGDEEDEEVEVEQTVVVKKRDSLPADESSNKSPLHQQLFDEPLDLSVSKNGQDIASAESRHLHRSSRQQKSQQEDGDVGKRDEEVEEPQQQRDEEDDKNNEGHCLGQQKQQSAFFEYFKKTFVGENQFLKIKNNEIYSF